MVAIQRATVVMALLLGAPAQATPDDQGLMAQSRAHFEAGRAFHRLGRFAEAVREFEAAYALTHLPEMLMNIGTAYWRAGDLRRACASYRRFLDEAGPTHPARGQAKQSVVELERAIAAAPPPPVERPAAPEPLVSAQASRRDLVDAPRPARS